MKFKNWNIDTLIAYLKDCKCSGMVNLSSTLCSGEIVIKNGNSEDLSEEIAVDILRGKLESKSEG